MTSLETKWSCEYCTYENFPISMKCTMCRAPRPVYVICEQAVAGLYISTPSPPSAASATAAGRSCVSPGGSSGDEAAVITTRSSAAGSGTKWACSGCTYLNWAHDASCLQCLTPRRRIGSPHALSAGNLHDALAPLHIRTASSSTESLTVHQRQQPSIAATSTASPRSHSRIQDSPPRHWMCGACTYDNVAPSRRCAVCGRWRSVADLESDHAGGATAAAPPQQLQLMAAAGSNQSNYELERRLRRLRRRQREADWSWLNACVGAVDGQLQPVESYLAAGGDPARQLTKAEVALLNRPSTFEPGLTLVHLAIRFCQEHVLGPVLSRMGGTGSGVKRMPCFVVPDLAKAIRRSVASTIRQKKINFACYFLTDMTWFALPCDIDDLPDMVQQQLWQELLDSEAQKQLEVDEPAVNWSLEVTERLGSRLYALWNRTAGDCLLDSVMQAICGVFDRESSLRRALFDSLHEAANHFYPRWRDYELLHTELLQYDIGEEQLRHDWLQLLALGKPGSPLEQLHVWALAHLIRRPIIVYGVKFVKTFRGETIDYARFEGVYLPMLWDISFCSKSPVCLGYTRGHFSALVPVQPPALHHTGAGADFLSADTGSVVFYPLMSHDNQLLPVHFISRAERGREERLLRQWLDVCVTDGGCLVAQCQLPRPPLLVAQMLQEWLNYYRSMCPVPGPSVPCRLPPAVGDVSSDNESGAE